MVPKKLAESIILQSMEDLWDFRHRAESVSFFAGPDFHHVAEAAGLDTEKKTELMRLVKRISRHTAGIIPRRADRAGSSPHALSASP